MTLSIREGQRYRATEDFHTNALTHWRAPFTGGNSVVFPRGEIFVVLRDPPEGATAAYCRPERYDDLHPILVPEEDRSAAKYDGYSLVIELQLIRDSAELVGGRDAV